MNPPTIRTTGSPAIVGSPPLQHSVFAMSLRSAMASPRSVSAVFSSSSLRFSEVHRRFIKNVERDPHLSRESARSRWGIVLEKH